MSLTCALSSAWAKSSVPDVLEAQLYDFIEQQLPWPGATFELSNLRAIGEIPEPPWRLELRSGERFRGQMRVRVFPESGGTQSSAWISANISVSVPVLVVSHQVNSGGTVQQNIHTELKPLASLPHDAVFNEDELSDHVARRTLNSGEIVRESVLIRPVVVQRNQVVAIVVRRGSVVITDRGIAMQAARAGEPVRVKSLSSDKVITAIAKSDGRVEVP